MQTRKLCSTIFVAALLVAGVTDSSAKTDCSSEIMEAQAQVGDANNALLNMLPARASDEETMIVYAIDKWATQIYWIGEAAFQLHIAKGYAIDQESKKEIAGQLSRFLPGYLKQGRLSISTIEKLAPHLRNPAMAAQVVDLRRAGAKLINVLSSCKD